MTGPGAKFAVAGLLLLSSPGSAPMRAQAADAVLSGSITDSSGKAIPHARIGLRNVATGKATETQTDAVGRYAFSKLPAGDYEVSVTAEGFSARLEKVTIAESAHPLVNLTLGGMLSLGDLGFPSSQIQGSAEDQARLDKRSHMLKVHQQLGLITTIPLVATVFSSSFAGGKSTSSTGRDIHAALGTTTVILYGTSAYYAIFAPKIEGTKPRGNIRLHKALAWVHGAGMILTPILGGLADEQKSQGEKVHGIASAHGAVGVVTVAAYGAAILAESLK